MENKSIEKLGFDSKRISIKLLGTGIFLMLTILGFSVLFKNGFKDIFIILEIKPLYNYLITPLISSVISIFILLLFLNKVKKVLQSGKGENSIFITAIIAYVLSQILVFLYSYFYYSFLPENYFDNLVKYLHYYNVNLFVSFIRVGFELILFALFILIINKASKQVG